MYGSVEGGISEVRRERVMDEALVWSTASAVVEVRRRAKMSGRSRLVRMMDWISGGRAKMCSPRRL